MNIILWIVQILLGLLFVIAGITKLIEQLEKMAEWTARVNARRFGNKLSAQAISTDRFKSGSDSARRLYRLWALHDPSTIIC